VITRRSIRLLPGVLLVVALAIQGCGAAPANLVTVSKRDASAGANQETARASTPAPTEMIPSVAATPTPADTVLPTAVANTGAADGSLLALGGGPAVGQPAPDFSLVGLNGKTIRLSDFRGQPVVVNFFATWCGPCKEELPEFQATYQKDRAKGLQVLLVDLTEPPAEVQAFAKELGLSMPIAVDEKGVVASQGYALTNIPATYFIDGHGVIRGVQFGPVAPKTLADNIDSLLAGANAAVASSRQVPAGCCPAP
jgi:cytochrome c biogenesis protein CcmG/thiol:disulfide interchange protein DsbE